MLPEHEGLRRAVHWLSTQTPWDAKLIEEASRRFDLSPVDEDFLLRHFRDAKPPDGMAASEAPTRLPRTPCG